MASKHSKYRNGRVAVMTHITPELRKAIKLRAVEEDSKMERVIESLLRKALNLPATAVPEPATQS